VRKRAVAGSILASFGILAVGWQIGAATPVTPAVTSTGTGAGSSSGTGSSADSGGTTTTPTASPSTATTTSSLKDGTYTGTTEQTPFGNMQVAVVISGGKISDVKALQLTDQGGRSVQISNYAAPILRKEVLASQSANVSNVNGATYTTDGYLSSLQSALDKAAS
jgi:uncharacterized protein with FMN-binding domain